MTRREFAIWAAALQTYFPKYDMLPTPEAKDLWYQELKDLSADVATAVLRKWVATEKWPPSIAEIRAAASDMINGPAPSWGDGWKEVRNAFAHCGTHEIEKVKKLVSPATFQAIQRIGWWDMCMSENPEALRAQFRQVYEVIVQREQQDKLIAPSTRDLISGIVGSLPQLEEGRK